MTIKFETDKEKEFLHDLLISGIYLTEHFFVNGINIADAEHKRIFENFRQRCFLYLQDISIESQVSIKNNISFQNMLNTLQDRPIE